jgi:hypothetical protein
MINFNNSTKTRTKTYWAKTKVLKRLVNEQVKYQQTIKQEQKDVTK